MKLFIKPKTQVETALWLLPVDIFDNDLGCAEFCVNIRLSFAFSVSGSLARLSSGSDMSVYLVHPEQYENTAPVGSWPSNQVTVFARIETIRAGFLANSARCSWVRYRPMRHPANCSASH